MYFVVSLHSFHAVHNDALLRATDKRTILQGMSVCPKLCSHISKVRYKYQCFTSYGGIQNCMWYCSWPFSRHSTTTGETRDIDERQVI